MTARDEPSPESLAWVVANVPGAVRVSRVQRLTGGITSAVHALTLVDSQQRRHYAVLRRWTGSIWPDGGRDDPRVAVQREAAVLTSLGDSGLPVPRLLAADATGDVAGHPAVLMTRLPGCIRLAPADPATWVRDLAEMLPRVHAAAPDAALPGYESWFHLDEATVPRWTARADMWREAIAVAQQPYVVPAGGFVHHDYQPFNVLWSRERHRISGIVDWVWASQGPPEEDVAHCRLNICLLASAELAEEFRDAYEAAAGRRLDPWWDVASVVDYTAGWTAEGLQRQAGRRLRISADDLNGRVESLLAGAMRRLSR